MRWLIVLSAILWVTAVEEKYCGKLNECCDGKDDRCGHNYRGSICYCDDFCMDPSREHGDCCPDFKPVCSLVLPPPSNFTKEVQPPPPRTERTALPTCTHKRKTYLENQTATCYCSKCTCKIRSGVAKWECERECLSNEDILFHDVNKERLWKAYVYPEFEKVPLWGAIRKLGTKEARQLVPVKRGKVNIKYFNATEEWGKFITPVVDQGWCGSDVVVAISSVIADRYAINTRGKRLQYPQYKMSCHTPFSPRDVVTALINVRKKGLKSLGSSLRNPTVFGRVRMVYSLRSNDDTMAEIMQAGPVLAVMKVYQDFFHYRKGVYRHSGVGNGRLIGWHTVRILGWGEDNGELYWLAANSWGTRWGEGGYFRIARGVNECNIERFVAGARVLVNSYSYLKHPYH